MSEDSRQLKRLERELWDLLMYDGGKEIDELRAIRKREDRRGRMKRLLCRAIDKSSLATFGGKLYHFGGRTYVPMERPVFHNVIFTICSDRIQVPDADLVRMGDIYQDCCNVVFSKPLMISNDIMIFRNGVLDVENCKFHRKFDARFVQLWAVDYDYEPGMRTFLWEAFINEVLPDPYWQRALQMFLGATFIDRKKVKIEHIVILLGKGANGKSVIQEAVCGVLGQDYVSTMEVGRLCTHGADGDMAVAEINGKRLNYCTEMEETDFYRKSARLKAIVSGEMVTARQLYGNPFKAMNLPLLMANANRLPFFNKQDEAMMRRVYVIPFNVTISEDRQDKSLGDKLSEEYPGILNWILDGRRMFIENDCRLPQDTSISKLVNAEKTQFNSVLKFMDIHKYLPTPEGTYVQPVVWRTATDLHADYTRWCKQNYLTDIVKIVTFKRMLVDSGYHMERRTKGMTFALYGNAKERIARMKDKMKYLKKDDTNLLWLDGIGYCTTLRQLAEYTGVSYHTLTKVKGLGYLDECIKQNKDKSCYNVAGIIEVLRRMRIIATDEEQDMQRKYNDFIHKERNRFNARMKSRGWPYRKYASSYEHIDEGIKVVPDHTTEDEAMEMAVRDGYGVENLRGENPSTLKQKTEIKYVEQNEPEQPKVAANK